MTEIDFQGLAQALLCDVRELLPRWLPGGRLVGNEYTCGSIRGENGDSLKVNITSGKWKDFATDHGGGDLISLYATIKSISQGEAAKQLLDSVGLLTITKRQSPTLPASDKLIPPPPGTPVPHFTHAKHGRASASWSYRDKNGSILFYVARFDNKITGKKEIVPFSWSKESNKFVKKWWPSPRPLYGSECFKDNETENVLIVEGEKSAEAARTIAGERYFVTTWPSGSKAWDKVDWSPVYGKKILIWPDADDAGITAAHGVATHLSEHCNVVKIIGVEGLSDGWDAANALEEGFDYKRFIEWARPRVIVFAKPNSCGDSNNVLASLSPLATKEKLHSPYFYFNGKFMSPLYRNMANDFLKQGSFISSGAGDYYYQDGYWSLVEDGRFKKLICDFTKDHIQPRHIDGFAKIIRGFCHVSAFNFKPVTNKLNLNNGILDLTSHQLIPHSNEYLFKYKIPIDYDPTAKCEAWQDFLNHVFSGDKTLALTAQKIFGYILMGGEPFMHKAFVLYGTGRNGKSTFLSVLKKLLGSTNYAAVSLQSLDRPFSAVALDGALANILEETPNDKINSHAFKAAVGGGELNMAKKYHDEYVGKVTARFIFACNEMPIFHDNTTALVDRLFFLPFTRYIPEAERDTQIDDKLQKELPGILNWAIEGMKLVLADRYIEPPVASLKLLEKYKLESDPLYNWVHNKIEFGNTYEGESTSELYKQYRQDMQDSGFVPKNAQVFYKNFKRFASQLAHRSATTEFKYERILKMGKRVRGFTAIYMKRDGDL